MWLINLTIYIYHNVFNIFLKVCFIPILTITCQAWMVIYCFIVFIFCVYTHVTLIQINQYISQWVVYTCWHWHTLMGRDGVSLNNNLFRIQILTFLHELLVIMKHSLSETHEYMRSRYYVYIVVWYSGMCIVVCVYSGMCIVVWYSGMYIVVWYSGMI